MRPRIRMIATAIIFLVVTLSFLHWKVTEIPDYLPQEAHDYFHPVEQSGERPNTSKETPQTKLDHILGEFLERPIVSYDESVQSNSKTCPTEGVNYDRNAVNGNVQTWREIPSSQISDWRQSIVTHLRQKQKDEQEKTKSGPASAEDGQEKVMRGARGIVMAAGDRDAAVRARTNIRFLKSYNCTLTVEIFHFSDELSEPDKSLLEELSQLELPDEGQEGHSGMKVTVRQVRGVEKGHDWKAFQIKGAAIQQSSFDEILYLDTDSYLLRNPDYLFEGKYWKETGLLLWPDYTKSHPTNPLWRLLGQPCRDEYEGESGQMLISRTLHQDLLWLVEFFALHHKDFYGFMGGDRDSFRAAALLLGKKWAGPGRMNAAAGVVMSENAQGGGHTMLQADPEGRWMFVHANLIKHAHFMRPLWSRIHRVAQDKYESGTTYGNIDPPNDRVGDGVQVHVSSTPRMISTMSAFTGYDEALVVEEDWDTYEELRGFEEKWFGFGAVH